MTRIFSGIRPSGKLHLGNYLGAIKNWIELQDTAQQAIFAVVDYHGITTPYDPKTYPQQVIDVILDYLAAGVNPDKALLIRQSKIQQHPELAWIFGTITPLGWLERLPTYKEKADQIGQSSDPRAESYQNNVGILTYPVLMAADILVYKSNLVPVGDDQKAHIDITNEIGAKFNHLFGEVFEPVKMYRAEGARIMSLQDPAKKMSKTGDDGIALTDDPDTIAGKIKRAVTDSGREVKFDPTAKPALSNLLGIYTLLTGKKIDSIEREHEGKSYADFKNGLTEAIVEYLKPFQARRKEFASDRSSVENLLEQSEEKAIAISAKTMAEVKAKMGLG